MKVNAMPHLHGESQDVGLCARTAGALADTPADGWRKVGNGMSHKAAVSPRKDSSRNWNSLIVICASTILIAVLIVIELLVLPR